MSKGRITSVEWDARKDAIVSLYIEHDATMDDLIKTMRAQGFHASKGQYMRQFREWRIAKNLPEKQWRAIIRRIKARGDKPSDVLFHGLCLPPSKVQKAIQRYDLPRLCPSPSPSSPDVMDDIRVCTPPSFRSRGNTSPLYDLPLRLSPCPGLNIVEETQISTPQASHSTNSVNLFRIPKEARSIGVARSYPYECMVNLIGIPFFEFQNCLNKLLKPAMQGTLQITHSSSLEKTLLLVAHQLLEARTMLKGAGMQLANDVSWEVVSGSTGTFPIPLTKVNPNSSVDIYRCFIEFIVIGSTNNLFDSYLDKSLGGLVESICEVKAVEKFLMLVREHNLYAIVESIIDLDIATTISFGAEALLYSIDLEDEQMVEMLLAKKVPLDVVRYVNPGYVSAIHLAVEQQNESLVRRLLEAGIDPDGYITDESSSALKPLSRLLLLFSIKPDPRVIQISTSVFEIILNAQRRLYDNHHCESYLVSLFIRAWLAEATECLAFLQEYCKNLVAEVATRTQNPAWIWAIAVESNPDWTIQKILGSAPLHSDFRILNDDNINPILSMTIQKRSSRILQALFSGPIWEGFQSPKRLETLLFDDLLAVPWLVQQDIDFPINIWLSALYAAIESEDSSLCKFIIDRKPETYRLLLEPDFLDRKQISQLFSTLSINWDIATVMITNLPKDLSTMQACYILRQAFLAGESEFCQYLIKFLLHHARRVVAFAIIVSEAFRGHYTKDKVGMILEELRGHFAGIEWSSAEGKDNFERMKNSFGGDEEGNTKEEEYLKVKFGVHTFGGSLSLLQYLVENGLPLNKSLLISCARGPDVTETLPWIIAKDSRAIGQLTPGDIHRCLTHHCGESRCPIFGGCPPRPVERILRLLVGSGLCSNDPWSIYMTVKNPKAIKIAGQGRPCNDCSSFKKCTKPVHAAIETLDIDTVQNLIENGFAVSHSSCTASFLGKIPLGIAIKKGSASMVNLLIQAGADVNLPCCNYDLLGESSPLALASGYGYFDITCRLLKAGADANNRASIRRGRSALEEAAGAGRLDIVYLLVANSYRTPSFKHNCRRAARRARSMQENMVARFLEQQVVELTESLGKDEIDDGIDSLCKHQLERVDWDMIQNCVACRQKHPTSASWYASLIYYTDATVPPWLNTGLEDILTGEESLQELEGLIGDKIPGRLASYWLRQHDYNNYILRT